MSSGSRGYNDHGGGNRRPFQQRRSDYRIIVSGLPSGASWQDLKDHFREVAEVCYAEVKKDGSNTGLVEFSRIEDMRDALKKLNDSELRSHEGSTAYIRLKEHTRSGSRSRSRSYSPKPRRRRSPSRSRSRSSGERDVKQRRGRSRSRS